MPRAIPSPASSHLTGSAHNDTLVGDDGSNTVAGGGGHDRLFGRGGDDILAGGDGNDGLYGDGGQDFLFGDAGNDLLWGGSGDDLLEGGAGADTLDGAEGEDTASYAGSKDGVVVNLATGIGSGGDAWGDTLTGIENLIGSARDDTLIGDAGANRLDGGAGQDWVTGGEGDDTFVFSGAWGHDDITDFGEGDIVELDAAAFARLDDVLANYIQNGNHIALNFGDGRSITFQNTSIDQISADDFRLVS